MSRGFRTKPSPRRRVFLSLVSQIENGLRVAYAVKHARGLETQASIARKLGIDRSAVHRRLTGQASMKVATIADMAWALGCTIDVKITPKAIGESGKDT